MTKYIELTKALDDFFNSTKRLKDIKVIRSDKFLGDIAEYICTREFNMRLADGSRQVGYDGFIGDDKVQVKYHGGKSTTVSCGDPRQYNELIIIIGPDSTFRKNGLTARFYAIRIPSNEVKKNKYTKNQLSSRDWIEIDV